MNTSRNDALFDLHSASMAIDVFRDHLENVKNRNEDDWCAVREWTNALHLSVRMMLTDLRNKETYLTEDN